MCSPRVENLSEWGRHVVENVRAHALRSPDPRLDELLAELERYVPAPTPGPDHVGFAVPLRLRCDEGELRLITTLTWFATALDVTLAELHLEAYLPADEPTAHPPRTATTSRRRGRRVVPARARGRSLIDRGWLLRLVLGPPAQACWSISMLPSGSRQTASPAGAYGGRSGGPSNGTPLARSSS